MSSDFEEYVAARGPALLALAVLVVGDEARARAAVQEVLGRALTRWDTLVHHEDPDAMLRHALLVHLTRGRRARAATGSTDWDASTEHGEVWRAWLGLHRSDRAVLALRHAEQLTVGQIATLAETTERTTRARIQRAETAMRKALPPVAAIPGAVSADGLLGEVLRARIRMIDTWPVELSSRAATASRARRSRQLTWGGVGLLVLVVLVPLVFSAVSASLRTGRTGVLPDEDVRPDSALPAGWRAESWHGVELGVPGDWGNGSLTGWCREGAEPTARVDRPSAGSPVQCDPGLAPGVQFRAEGVARPEVPDGLDVEERVLAGVAVLVVTPEKALTDQILSTLRVVERVDAAGCEVQRAIPRAGRNFQPAEAEQTSLSICRYDVGVPGANLAQSERLSVIDSVKARKAVEAAPAIVAPTACLDVPGEQVVLIASDQGDLAWVHLGQCQGLDDDRTHLLTGDVLFWVLSPGWSGPVDDLPLPDRLRRPAPR